jgi:HAD superfamily hydrolase (TIGR01509 family)
LIVTAFWGTVRNLAMAALLETNAEAGLQLDVKETQAPFLGRLLASIFKILESHYNLTLTGDALELMRERLYAAFRQELEPKENIVKKVQNLNIPFSVWSSSQMERMRLSLEVTELLPAFLGKLFSSSMVAQGTPAPDLFLLAAETLGIKPEQYLVIEVSPAGVTAAKEASMSEFGFTGGSHPRSAAHHDALHMQLSPIKYFLNWLRLAHLINKHEHKPPTQDPCYCCGG